MSSDVTGCLFNCIGFAKLGLTDANCELNTLDILNGSVKTFILSRSLKKDLFCIAIELFLLLFFTFCNS